MAQTLDQRRYWAQRRKAEGRMPQKKKQARPVVLLATSEKEYDEIRRMHPNMKVRLDKSHQEQGQLFDTREFKDV